MKAPTIKIAHRLTLAFALAGALSATAQDAPKFSYLVPDGTAPNGKFALAGFENSSEPDTGNIYIARIGKNGQMAVASEAIFEDGFGSPDPRGYGAKLVAWGPERYNGEGHDYDYAIVQYHLRNSVETRIFRLVNNRYSSQGFSEKKYNAKFNAALAKALKPYGVAASAAAERRNETIFSHELPTEDGDFPESVDFKEEPLDFEKPLYAIMTKEYTFSTEDSEEAMDAVVTVIVKFDFDPTTRSLKETVVSAKAGAGAE